MKNVAFTTLAVVSLTIFSTSPAHAQFSLGKLFGFGTPRYAAPYSTPSTYSNYGNGYTNAACPNGRCGTTANQYGTYYPTTNQYGVYPGASYNTYRPTTGYNTYQPSNGSQYGTWPTSNTPCTKGQCPTSNYRPTTPYQTTPYQSLPYGSYNLTGTPYSNPGLNTNGPYYDSY